MSPEWNRVVFVRRDSRIEERVPYQLPFFVVFIRRGFLHASASPRSTCTDFPQSCAANFQQGELRVELSKGGKTIDVSSRRVDETREVSFDVQELRAVDFSSIEVARLDVLEELDHPQDCPRLGPWTQEVELFARNMRMRRHNPQESSRVIISSPESCSHIHKWGEKRC